MFERAVTPEDIMKLANTASTYSCSIVISFKSVSVDVKSIMGMFVSLTGGEVYKLHVLGNDKNEVEDARKEIKEMMESFGLQVEIA